MFITFEGIEGSGKSTALESLCAALGKNEIPYTRTREPGGSALGRELRSMLLDARRDVSPEAELFLYLADRAQHVRDVIRPRLQTGEIVFSDRYADSTIVYQGYGRGFDVETLFHLNETATGALWPDKTLIFDLEPVEGLRRARSRNKQSGTDISEGRFEAEAIAFHQKVRQGYLTWAQRHPHRFQIIDASRERQDVFAQVLGALAALPGFPPLS